MHIPMIMAALLTLMVGGASGTAPSTPGLASQAVDVWMGSIDTGAQVLRIEVHVTTGENGTQTAEIVSLDQDNVRIPVDRITIGNGTFTFTADAVGGRYEGKLDEAGSSAEGTWSQMGYDFPLKLTRRLANE